MAGDVVELTTEAEREEGVRILRQLWEDTPRAEVEAWLDDEGYRLLGYEVDGTVVGVAGVFVQTVLHHERTAWVQDLVIDGPHRNQGHGTAFLDALETWAGERDCGVLALANDIENERATDFYDDHMDRFGYIYERDL